MTHYYGTLQGSRGEVMEMETKDSGLVAQAASWQGGIRVVLYDVGKTTHVRVARLAWHGKGVDDVLYDGPIGTNETIAAA